MTSTNSESSSTMMTVFRLPFMERRVSYGFEGHPMELCSSSPLRKSKEGM